MAATLAIYAAIVAAAALLVVGIVKLVKHIKEENKSLKEKTEAYKLARYESQKLVKSYDDLIKRYNELNNKVIKTDEDTEALRALGAELEAIDGLEVTYKVNGEVDKETIERLKIIQQEELAKQREKDKEQQENIRKDVKNKSVKLTGSASRYRDDLLETYLNDSEY
jgi:uncharacterized protein YoxC